MRPTPLLASLLSLFAVAACSSEAAQAKPDPLQAPKGLAAATLVTPADNPLTLAKAELGKQLFFDPRLSGTGNMSCSTCHPPEKAFADGAVTSKKDDGSMNTRNTPTMFNVGYLERLYWDGRAKTLEANVAAAWKAQMGGKPEEVAKKLAAVTEYAAAFQAAFGAPPSEDTIAKALASFLRTLRSGDSPFDRWRSKDESAISDAAKKGAELFMSQGCGTCHVEPLFTDRQFRNVGIGMKGDKAADVGAAGEKAFNDPTKTGAFKVPSLRDVAKTAPYFHDGSVATLKEAVTLMASGGIDNKYKDPQLLPRKLTPEQIDQLVAFLESLTGRVEFTPPKLPK